MKKKAPLFHAMRLLLATILMCAPHVAFPQDKDIVEETFMVFTLSEDSSRVEMKNNINFYSKMPGIFVIKKNFYFLEDHAKTKVERGKDIFFEIFADSILSPSNIRLVSLKIKRGKRVLTAGTGRPLLGPNVRPKSVVDITIEKVGKNIYRFRTEDIPPGHYVIYYQDYMYILQVFYDFDLIEKETTP